MGAAVIKAIARKPDGRQVLMLGLSFGNLDKFKAEARDTYILVDGAALSLPIDVMIFSGENEQALAAALAPNITAATKIYTGPMEDER